MIIGKDKQRFKELQEENEVLKAEIKKLKTQAPQISEVLTLLYDLQSLGVGHLEVRRVSPDSFFLLSPQGRA